jgi:hypothetical protein
MATLDASTRRGFGSADRRQCAAKSCFATFEGGPAKEGEVRHCNRAGPDGGHAHRWDGQSWQVVVGRLEYDRT